MASAVLVFGQISNMNRMANKIDINQMKPIFIHRFSSIAIAICTIDINTIALVLKWPTFKSFPAEEQNDILSTNFMFPCVVLL